MSMPPSVYLGPYAEWLVTSDEITDEYRDLPARSDPWPLKDNQGVGYGPEVEVDGETRHRLALVPGPETRPGQPELIDLCDFGAEVVRDVRGVDAAAQIDWFAVAYRAELAELEAFFGRAPNLCWGLVYYP